MFGTQILHTGPSLEQNKSLIEKAEQYPQRAKMKKRQMTRVVQKLRITMQLKEISKYIVI